MAQPSELLPKLSFTKKQLLLIANLFFWIVFAVFDTLNVGGMFNGYYSAIFIRFLLHAVLFAGLIYPNLYYLYPKFFSNAQYWQYAIAALTLIGINIILRIELDEFLIQSNSPDGVFAPVYNEKTANQAINAVIEAGFYSYTKGFSSTYYVGMIIGSLGVFFVTTPIRLVEDWYNKQQLEIQLLQKQVEQNQAALKIKEEKIKFLKAQTDPHFLLNAISGVYHLALIQNKNIDHALLKLSELMGYLLGYGKEDFILLKHEIQFIENYIDFNQTIHKDDDLYIGFQHNVDDMQKESVTIPPMLIQPFFENAVKYGSFKQNSRIESSLYIENSWMKFIIRNNMPIQKEKKISHGIGINNVRERLQLFFPDNHRLNFTISKDSYQVELYIPIKTQGNLDQQDYLSSSFKFNYQNEE